MCLEIKRRSIKSKEVRGEEFSHLIADLNAIKSPTVLKKIMGIAYVELMMRGLTKDELKKTIGHIAFLIKQKESNNV